MGVGVEMAPMIKEFIAKLIFNFKLEDEIALFLIYPPTHQISGCTSQISSGTSNPTKKVYNGNVLQQLLPLKLCGWTFVVIFDIG